MKKLFLFILVALYPIVSNAQYGFTTIYERGSYAGEHGGEFNFTYQENKKGKKTYYMFFQSYKYDYIKDLQMMKIGKEEHFTIFIKNLNTVMNIWDFKPEFKEGRGFSGVGYSLNVLRESPDHITIHVDLDGNGTHDDFVILSRDEVTKIYNELVL